MNHQLSGELLTILERESEAVRNIPINDNYEAAIHSIVHHTRELGGKLVTSGMGKAGHIALNIATTFTSTGTTAVCLHPADALHGDVGVIGENDVLLVLSNSGETSEILALLNAARAIHPALEIIAICGDNASTLAREASILLFTGGAPEVCPLGFTPTTSITVMSVIGDLLAVSVMRAIAFTKEQYALRHQGGTLGIKSRQ